METGETRSRHEPRETCGQVLHKNTCSIQQKDTSLLMEWSSLFTGSKDMGFWCALSTYDDGDKEDISVEELESLLRVVRVGSSLKDEGPVFHVEEQPYGFEWQREHLFMHSSVFDVALDSEPPGVFEHTEFDIGKREGFRIEVHNFEEKKDTCVSSPVVTKGEFGKGVLGKVHNEAVVRPSGVLQHKRQHELTVGVLHDTSDIEPFRGAASGRLEWGRARGLSGFGLGFRVVMRCFMNRLLHVFIRSTNAIKSCLILLVFRPWEFLGWDPPSLFVVVN